MALDTIIKGNATKLIIPMTKNGIAYPDLGDADRIKLAMVKHSDDSIAFQVDDTNSNVSVDDPDEGTITWQMTSAQTGLLDITQYSVAIQVENGSEFLEWQDIKAFNVKKQLIPNT